MSETIIPMLPEQIESTLSSVLYLFLIEKNSKKFFLLIGPFSSRVFIHDYPNNPKIEAHYQSNGRLYYSYYNIISLGTYPPIPKLTQKPRNNTPQYPIPNKYIVETEVFERKITCESKYISNLKVYYTISWKEGRTEWSVNSTKSSTAVVNTFLQVSN